MDKINLKEILNRVYDKEYRSSYKTEYSEQCIIEAMREACNQVLKLAAENIRWTSGQYKSYYFSQQQSILNTINEVE